MALIQTAGYGIGKIGSMFSPKTGEGNSVKKAVLKKTKVRREVIARNKILEKKRLDKRRKIEKESLLEATKTKGKSGLGKLLSVSDPGGIFQKTLDFIGILLLGWLVDKLPQIIDWVKNLIKRIKLLFSSLKSFIKNIGNWFKGLGNLFTGTLDNIKRFDFTDSEGKMKKAMTDMENAFKGMQSDIEDMKTAVSGDVESQNFAGELSGDAVNQTKQLLRNSEGFREKAYWDVNAWRIGYGTDTITDAQGNVTAVTKDSVVTREDAERDLERRISTGFMPKVAGQVGENWSKLPTSAQAALTSVGYNYGSLPSSVVKATKTGNLNTIADSVEALKTHNKGVNARRRIEEANIIRGAGDGRQARGANQTPAYQRAVTVGRALEGQGYRAWQHPDFNVHSGYTGSGRERVMRRSYSSYHNYGEALDYPLSHNSEAQLNKLAAYFRQNKSALGIAEILWKTSGHYDHLHVSFKGGGSIDKRLAGVPSLKGAGQRQQIVIIEEEPAPAAVASGGSGGGMIIIANDSLNRFMKNQLLSELAYT